jgi:hypothetical protein
MRRRSHWTFAVVLAACGSDPGSGADAGNDRDGDVLADGMEGDGPIISTCPAGTWCVETPPNGVTGLLHAIDASDANDVFAVGDGGTIIRRQNGTWTTMTSNTTENLRAIWVHSSSDAWAVGQNGTVVRWNGATWTVDTNAPDISYAGVWGSGPNDVWMIGSASHVHFTGGTSYAQGALSGAPVSISGVSANDIWVASESGKISHYTGTWQVCNSPAPCAVTPTSFFAIAARAANDVWAALPGMGTLRWNGATWTPFETGTTLFASIHAPGENNAWGVGGSKVGHWDGNSWTISTPVTGFTDSLYGVTGAGPHTWAVGQDAAILYRRD